MKINKLIVNENWIQFKHLLTHILPRDKKEILIFSLFLCFYISYSIILVFKANIIDFPPILEKYTCDLYFGFDTPSYYKNGYFQLQRHPLLNLIAFPLVTGLDLGTLILGHTKAKTLLWMISCSSMISFSVVYIFRYLKNILELNTYPLYALTIFFGFFSTNLILCFTPESFTFTAFFLSFCVYYYSDHIKQGKKVCFLSNLFFIFTLGGVTLSNIVKGMIPMLFTKQTLTLQLKKIFIITILFIVAVSVNLTLLQNQDPNTVSLEVSSQLKGNTNSNIEESTIHFITNSLVTFYGLPIMFSKIEPASGLMYLLGVENILVLDCYRHYWQYITVFLIVCLLSISIIRNRKEKLVQLIIFLLGCDFFIHIIMRFGLNEGFIFGSHWVYCVPILLGWLYKSLNTKYARIFVMLITPMIGAIIIKNLSELIRFINFATIYFSVN